jgi:single-strand DNA-binding protein
MISATVVGNIGSDCEVRDAAGTPVASFRVASNDKSGKAPTTQWISVSIFGVRATKIAQYLTRGTKVAVSGSLTTREFESKGEKRVSLELRASDVEFCGGSKKDDADQSRNDTRQAEESEIPF